MWGVILRFSALKGAGSGEGTKPLPRKCYSFKILKWHIVVHFCA